MIYDYILSGLGPIEPRKFRMTLKFHGDEGPTNRSSPLRRDERAVLAYSYSRHWAFFHCTQGLLRSSAGFQERVSREYVKFGSCGVQCFPSYAQFGGGEGGGSLPGFHCPSGLFI